MNNKSTRYFIGLLIAVAAGQVIAYFTSPDSWKSFMSILPKIISMIAFWGPIVALIAFGFVALILKMLGFATLEDLRRESVDENNPSPAIIFVGTLIASILFLMIVIRP
jgi:hypothetical protein